MPFIEIVSNKALNKKTKIQIQVYKVSANFVSVFTRKRQRRGA